MDKKFLICWLLFMFFLFCSSAYKNLQKKNKEKETEQLKKKKLELEIKALEEKLK